MAGPLRTTLNAKNHGNSDSPGIFELILGSLSFDLGIREFLTGNTVAAVMLPLYSLYIALDAADGPIRALATNYQNKIVQIDRK